MSRGRPGWLAGIGAVLGGVLLAGMAMALAAPVVSAAKANVAAPRRAVMILLDTDTSMASGGIAAEQGAARQYLRALPADVLAGLITFSDRWRMALAPTTDRRRLVADIAAAKPAGARSAGLYRALSAAASVLHRLGAGARTRLLVLSDGEGLAGPAPIPHLPVDVVVWHFEGGDNAAALRALAFRSGGHVVGRGHVGALGAAVFPPLTAAHGAGRAPAAKPAAHPGSAASRSKWPASLTAVLAIVFTALFVLALLVIGSLGRGDRGRILADQIGRYGPRHSPAPAAGDGTVTRGAVSAIAQVLQSSNAEPGLARRLDLAGIARRPAEWVLLGCSACAALAAALTLLTGSALLGIPAGVLVGWLGMRLALNVRIGRRRAAFREQLPDVLQLMAGSLQSGFSLPQALDAVVREDTQPAAGEFSRALGETRIGADLEDALDGIATRMDSTDLRWTVMAIRIQREVGGNLAEVLRNTVATMRDRAYLHRHVRALSAEGRISAYILIALPLLLGAWLFLTDRAYLAPLYTTVFGLVMVVGAAVLFVVGVVWMRAAIKVEV